MHRWHQKHRFNFTKVGGVDYNLHQPQSINFIPGTDVIAQWASDYKTMQEQMITGDSPEFEQLISELKRINQLINTLQWKMAIDFPKPNN